MKKIAKVIFILVCSVIIIIVGYKGITIFLDKYEASKEKEKEENIEYTLYKLGNRKMGSEDWSTVQYSTALDYLETAALGESWLSNYDGMSKEEIKASALESLESYFETDYLKSYAALMFCADYFTEQEVEYFYGGTKKINALELQEQVEELLYKDAISLSTLLINKADEEICYTTNLRIKLAGDGCMSVEEMVSELYEFVYGGLGIPKVDEELLAKEITYEEIIPNYTNSFSGDKLFFADLSPVGKMVFLYMMPRYVVQIDKEAGSELWYNYFESSYEEQWNEIIKRTMFSGIIG